MASALPVVVTGYGACLDFCDDANALLIPSTVAPLAVESMGPSPAGYWWAEPDADALAALLRRVVDQPSVLEGLGEAGRARIVERFSWERTDALAARRLAALTRG